MKRKSEFVSGIYVKTEMKQLKFALTRRRRWDKVLLCKPSLLGDPNTSYFGTRLRTCSLKTIINRFLNAHSPLRVRIPFGRENLVGGEGGIRTHGSFESLVFKTSSLNRSDTSPHRNKIYYSTTLCYCQGKFQG